MVDAVPLTYIIFASVAGLLIVLFSFVGLIVVLYRVLNNTFNELLRQQESQRERDFLNSKTLIDELRKGNEGELQVLKRFILELSSNYRTLSQEQWENVQKLIGNMEHLIQELGRNSEELIQELGKNSKEQSALMIDHLKIVREDLIALREEIKMLRADSKTAQKTLVEAIGNISSRKNL